MKTLSVLLTSLLLSACVSVPVSPKFPAAPQQLMEQPAELVELPDGSRLSDLLDNATVNYGTFYQQRELLLGWQEWYRRQREIYESIK